MKPPIMPGMALLPISQAPGAAPKPVSLRCTRRGGCLNGLRPRLCPLGYRLQCTSRAGAQRFSSDRGRKSSALCGVVHWQTSSPGFPMAGSHRKSSIHSFRPAHPSIHPCPFHPSIHDMGRSGWEMARARGRECGERWRAAEPARRRLAPRTAWRDCRDAKSASSVYSVLAASPMRRRAGSL